MNHEQHMLQRTSEYSRLLQHNVNGRNVLELGVGTGELTKLLLHHGARKVVGYEFDPMLCRVTDPRFELRPNDYTKVLDWPSDGYCLVANPAYSTLTFIIASVLPWIYDVILMVPANRLDEFKALGFTKEFGLDGDAFTPPAEGEHYVVRRGFAQRFVDLHHECFRLETNPTKHRVDELSEWLPKASICAIGGIPIILTGGELRWCGNLVTANMLREHIIDALGLSAVLTYTNKNNKSLEQLGIMCAERGETWAYHWFTLTMVLANQPPEVQLAFARDGRFRLGWTIEKNYTGKVFTASAGLHEWLKFTAKHNDSSFDEATRVALYACRNVLMTILP